MKTNLTKSWILSIIYIVLGTALIVCGGMQAIDSFWSGMGGGLTVVGVLQMFRLVRYKTNATYKENADIVVNDERNRFIRTKAWSWAGYLFILIAAVSTIVFKLLEQDTLMFAASGSVCLITILYWISHLIISKKY